MATNNSDLLLKFARDITSLDKNPVEHEGGAPFTISRRVDDFIGKNRIITPKYTDEELRTMRKALHQTKSEGYASLKALVEKETTNSIERILRGGVTTGFSPYGLFDMLTEADPDVYYTSAMREFTRSIKNRADAHDAFTSAFDKLSAINKSKQVAETTGYLYHFAPSEARKSLAKSGFQATTDMRHRGW